jgi:foldase protein PrsA
MLESWTGSHGARSRPSRTCVKREALTGPMMNRSHSRLLVLLVPFLLLPAACGAGARVAGRPRSQAVPVPSDVPRGDVAIVGRTPIAAASFKHWLPVIRDRGDEGSVATGRRQAMEATVTFLVRAQWLVQEAAAEGIDESVLNKLVSSKVAHAKPGRHMSRSDLGYQTRLNIIAEALQVRHSKVPAVPQARVARYYGTHPTKFIKPGVRHTLIVDTRSRNGALAAKAALARGESWRTVAKRWSIDSSVEVGGAFAVVEGEQSPALERAVFSAAPKRLVGPVSLPPESGQGPTYYLFEVTGASQKSQEPLREVAQQIRQTLTEQLQQRSWSAFVRAYKARWAARTLCAPGYLVPVCRNSVASTRGRGP